MLSALTVLALICDKLTPLPASLFRTAMLLSQFILSRICSGDGLSSLPLFALKINANSFMKYKIYYS
jgi:hypothetical protein